MRVWIAALLALACACGESREATDSGTRDAGGGGVDSGDVDTGVPPVDAGGGGSVIDLISGEWVMAGSREGYVCVRRTLDETVWIKEFRPVAPLGTHHTVLTIDRAPSGPDGVFRCSATTNANDMIYGSGVGTEPLAMPPGVAVKVEAGQQLLLNLHLFNTTGTELTGISGIDAVVTTEDEVEVEAEAVLAGEEFFSIPARASNFEIEGRCTMAGDTTLFALMPHMHELGISMTVMAETSDGMQRLHDDLYSFDDQRYTVFAPVQLREGQRIQVTCRYDNPRDEDVTYGDSTLQEMCYASLYRYPPVGGGLTCTR
ncbi:MAG: hypothetical protein AAGE52_32000 [Myxococcota bacterium]